jgi:hypothetical protein
MSRKPRSASAGKALVAAAGGRWGVLGPPPLTSLDDPAAYARLEAALTAEVQPKGVLEQLRLRDVANLVWEAQRLRRARAVALALARRDAIVRLLYLGRRPGPRFVDEERTAADYLDSDAAAAAVLGDALQRLGLDESAIDATALQIALDPVERLDRLIFQAEQRRDAVLRDLQRAQDARAQALAEAAEAIDAEFEA